jgi:hypothetical protein
MEIEALEFVASAAFEVWLLVDDPDVELGIEMVLGRVLAPEQSDEVQEWIARKVIGGMCV